MLTYCSQYFQSWNIFYDILNWNSLMNVVEPNDIFVAECFLDDLSESSKVINLKYTFIRMTRTQN